MIDLMEKHEAALPDEALFDFLGKFGFGHRLFCESYDLWHPPISH